MKKLFISLCLLIVAISASAQFERGKVFVNTSLTGLDLSYNKSSKGHFGVEAMGGYFLLDNIALTGNICMDLGDAVDAYSFGVRGRYYFENNGIYIGAMLKDTSYSFKEASNDNDFAIVGEAGYAFFLSRTVTIEPAIYYSQSFTDNDYTQFGLKVGFSFYF